MSKTVTKPGPVAVQNAGHLMPNTGEAVPVSAPSEAVISQVMAEMGRRGGRIGGKRRLETLTPRRRRQLARLAALARWAKKKEPQI